MQLQVHVQKLPQNHLSWCHHYREESTFQYTYTYTLSIQLHPLHTATPSPLQLHPLYTAISIKHSSCYGIANGFNDHGKGVPIKPQKPESFAFRYAWEDSSGSLLLKFGSELELATKLKSVVKECSPSVTMCCQIQIHKALAWIWNIHLCTLNCKSWKLRNLTCSVSPHGLPNEVGVSVLLIVWELWYRAPNSRSTTHGT